MKFYVILCIIILVLLIVSFLAFVFCVFYDAFNPCVIEHNVPKGGSYCQDCGKQLYNVCSNCEFTPISFRVKHCPHCGFALGDAYE